MNTRNAFVAGIALGVGSLICVAMADAPVVPAPEAPTTEVVAPAPVVEVVVPEVAVPEVVVVAPTPEVVVPEVPPVVVPEVPVVVPEVPVPEVTVVTESPVSFPTYTLPACAMEDSDNCYWDSSQMGNGQGESFIRLNGATYYQR